MFAKAAATAAYAFTPGSQPPIVPGPPTADEIAPPPAPGQAYTIDPSKGHPIRYAKSGPASERFPSQPVLLREIATGPQRDAVALRTERPGYPADEAGTFQTWTWAEYYAESFKFAKALIAQGHQPFETVAICGFNAPQWMFAHQGAGMVCGMSAGTYAASCPKICGYIAQTANSIVAVVDTLDNAKKYIEAVNEGVTCIKRIVVYHDDVPLDFSELNGAPSADFVVTYDRFIDLGASVSDADVDARIASVKIENACSIVCSSGTTGMPKGIMVSHDALAYSANAVIVQLKLPQELRAQNVGLDLLSFLPLSQIAARVLDGFMPLIITRNYNISSCVTFARPDALRGSLGLCLRIVRPTLFLAVPRVWDKFVEGIRAKAAADPATGLKKILVDFAKTAGLASSKARQTNGDGVLPRGISIADKLVYSKVRAALGIDRCVMCSTGAAPIAEETLTTLAALGIDVLEGFGMTETCGVGTMPNNRTFQFGTCGPATISTEVKIEHVPGRDPPGEGELCMRGRQILMGYLNDDALSRETIDAEGWLHSGDIVRFDRNGMMIITGRIKDLMVTHCGWNIAPVAIEAAVKRMLPGVSNVMLVGDRRTYNVCLFTLKAQPCSVSGMCTGQLIQEAAAVNPKVTTVQDAATDSVWREYLEKGIAAYNESAAISDAAMVRRFAVLPQDFTVPGGELTATLKLKRPVVMEKYSDIIDALYE